MLDVGISLRTILFDRFDCFLLTEIGAFDLEAQSAPMLKQNTISYGEPQQDGLGLSIDKKWIVRDSGNMLWLPPDYRPSVSSVTALAVAIGCSTGRVIIFNVSPERQGWRLEGMMLGNKSQFLSVSSSSAKTVLQYFCPNSHFLSEGVTVLVDRDLGYLAISKDAKSQGRCHDD